MVVKPGSHIILVPPFPGYYLWGSLKEIEGKRKEEGRSIEGDRRENEKKKEEEKEKQTK